MTVQAEQGIVPTESMMEKLRLKPWSRKHHVFIGRAIIDGKDTEVPIKSFTDMAPMFKGGYHMLIQGKTGSGKTHLNLTLVTEFLSLGWKAIYRDDGGLEFVHLLPQLEGDGQMLVFYPRDMILKFSGGDFGDRLRLKTFDYDRDKDILEMFRILHRAPRGTVLVIVFDVYVTDPEVSADFWSRFLQLLVHHAMQLPYSQKQDWLLAIDQANEIVQSHGHEVTDMHKKVRAWLEYNIKNLRKHKISILATTHRYKELSIGFRSQVSYNFVKRCAGHDIYDFMSKILFKASNKLFWFLLQLVTTLPPGEILFIDEEGVYDILPFEEYPFDRGIEVQAKGRIVKAGGDSRKRFDISDLMIVLISNRSGSYGDMKEATGLDRTTCMRRFEKMLSYEKVFNEMRHLEHTKPAVFRRASIARRKEVDAY